MVRTLCSTGYLCTVRTTSRPSTLVCRWKPAPPLSVFSPLTSNEREGRHWRRCPPAHVSPTLLSTSGRRNFSDSPLAATLTSDGGRRQDQPLLYEGIASCKIRMFSSHMMESFEDILINEKIPFPAVALPNQQEMPLSSAISLAKEKGMELVLENAHCDPPACRLLRASDLVDILIKRQDELADARQLEQDLSNQFSFDPSMKIRGIQISVVAEEADFVRKIQLARGLLKDGRRLEVVIPRASENVEEAARRIQRICGELKDLGKPVNLPLQTSKLVKSGVVLKVWPCTPAQAAAFRLPPVLQDDSPTSDINNAVEMQKLEERKRQQSHHFRQQVDMSMKKDMKSHMFDKLEEDEHRQS
eukprot:GHVS01034953.1.p2 GENE.GHVS01034953.1~~GHVS01034953.1.p2  ORF type:complete len:359 (+),score=46.35 GHVS01034953.1:120-1196(+)